MNHHKLDTAVEDILQHYGVKGMKWDVTKKKVKTTTNKIKIKSSDVSDSAKIKGKKLITKVFGKGKPTYKKAEPNQQLSKLLGDAMKKTNTSSKNSTAISNAKKAEKERSERAMSSNKQADALLEKYKKQGYKKHEKSKKTLTERGYTFRIKK